MRLTSMPHPLFIRKNGQREQDREGVRKARRGGEGPRPGHCLSVMVKLDNIQI